MTVNSRFSTLPSFDHFILPDLNKINVGIFLTLNWNAISGFLSTFTLTIRMFSLNVFFTSFNTGCISLQGWHQSA